MSDLVQRLRAERRPTAWARGVDTDYPTAWEPNPLCHEAAAEIEALRKGAQSPITQAWTDVLAERARQIEAEGWTPEHDDAEHVAGELALAACCYCVADEGDAPPAVWPWALGWWKPKSRRRNMVRAAALLLAEIEREDRAAKEKT